MLLQLATQSAVADSVRKVASRLGIVAFLRKVSCEFLAFISTCLPCADDVRDCRQTDSGAKDNTLDVVEHFIGALSANRLNEP